MSGVQQPLGSRQDAGSSREAADEEEKRLARDGEERRGTDKPGLLGAAAILLIRGYQRLISPVLPRCCRFEPTCSAYAVEAIRKRGFLRGSLMAAWRILRCNPFCKGGYDPVDPSEDREPGAGGRSPTGRASERRGEPSRPPPHGRPPRPRDAPSPP